MDTRLSVSLPPTAALALASNPVFHAHTKYIEVDYHYVREKVLDRDISIKFISMQDQVADVFLKSKLMVISSSSAAGADSAEVDDDEVKDQVIAANARKSNRADNIVEAVVDDSEIQTQDNAIEFNCSIYFLVN